MRKFILLCLAACTARMDSTTHDDSGPPSYIGGWPVNSTKDVLGGAAEPPRVGARFARFRLRDQFGDQVDTYDFLGHGTPVVVQIMAPWCPPCQELGRLLKGEETELTPAFADLPGHIRDGRVYWLTVMSQGLSGGEPTAEEIGAWVDGFSLPQIPVLDDGSQAAFDYAADGLPTVWLMDDEGVVIDVTRGEGEPVVLQWLVDNL